MFEQSIMFHKAAVWNVYNVYKRRVLFNAVKKQSSIGFIVDALTFVCLSLQIKKQKQYFLMFVHFVHKHYFLEIALLFRCHLFFFMNNSHISLKNTTILSLSLTEREHKLSRTLKILVYSKKFTNAQFSSLCTDLFSVLCTQTVRNSVCELCSVCYIRVCVHLLCTCCVRNVFAYEFTNT